MKNNSVWISSVILIAAGLFLCFLPGTSAVTIAVILGCAILAYGVIGLYQDFRVEGKSITITKIVFAVIAVIGLVLLIKPAQILSIAPVLVGIAITMDGIAEIMLALDIRKAGGDGWLLPLILACVTVVFGVLIFANPFGSIKAFLVLLGVSLIYDGASNLWIARKAKAR